MLEIISSVFSEIFRHDHLPAVGSSRGVAVYNNIKIIKNVDWTDQIQVIRIIFNSFDTRDTINIFLFQLRRNQTNQE